MSIVFEVPDFEQLQKEREIRVNNLLSKLDKSPAIDCELCNIAAILIQKTFRGYIGRKKYLEILYDDVQRTENDLSNQEKLQVAEGVVLVETYRMEQEILDEDDIHRNNTRLLHTSATVIQRAWRQVHKHQQKTHFCCSCENDYPDIYEYYNETKEICFCCEYHKCIPLLSEDLKTEEPPHDSDDNNNSSYQNKHILNSLIESDVAIKQKFKSLLGNNQSSIEFKVSVEAMPNCNGTSDLIDCESTRSLESFSVHEELEQEREGFQNELSDFTLKSVNQLKDIVNKLEFAIVMKNGELMKELTTRDELNSEHESLLIDVGDLEKNGK